MPLASMRKIQRRIGLSELAARFGEGLPSPNFVVYPVLQLIDWQEITKVIGVSCHQNMASSNSLCGNEDIGITFAGLGLFFKTRCQSKRLLVKI